jgi:hypothetical protein
MNATKPPLGFIPLLDAVCALGHRLYGPDWRPIGEVSTEPLFNPKSGRPNEANTSCLFEPEPERVITMIAEWCADGEIAAGCRSITGNVESLDRGVWRRPHWQYYFADGTINLELPLLENGRPVTDGRTAPQCPCEIFVRQKDIDRLIKTLSAPQKSKAGAPVEHDWDDYRQKFQQLWQQNGDFRSQQDQVKGWNSQAAAARKLLDYIQTRCDDGNEPHPKTVEDKIAGWVKEIDSGA